MPRHRSLQRRAQALIKRLTPGKRIHRDYRERTARYLGLHDLVPVVFVHRGSVGQATRLTMVRSELFARDYLLAYVDPAWLASVEPTCDAVASSVESSGTEWSPPPLVIVPASRARSRSATFRSILEHEFVHVNQILLGTFPRTMSIVRSRDALDNLVLCARAEYEANILQFTRWPRAFPREDGLSIEHWCAVRGYSQALERMFADLAAFDVTPRRATRALDMLRTQLPEIITRMGADGRLSPWFVERFEGHMALALSRVIEDVPESANAESLIAAAEWMRRRCV